MGWRLKIYFQCAFCTLVLLPIYGSREPLSYFLGEPFKQSHVLPIARRIVLQTASGTPSTGTDTKLEPSGVLATSSHASNGPVKIGFDVSSSLEISPVLAQVKERATIPTYPVESQYAPSRITPHKGSSSQPPITLPHKFEAVAPTIQPAIPPMPTSAPSDHFGVKFKHPTTISPSIKSHAPEVPGDLSPSSTIPPLAQSRKEMPGDGGKAPKSNSPLTAPHTSVSSPPAKIAPNQPNAPPDITKIAPSMIVPALPPPSATPPTIPAKRYGMPVAAPSMGISEPLSPMNDSHPKAESPLNPAHTPLISHTPPPNERLPYSPAPHEAQKPSNTRQAPLVSHSQPPEGRTVHSLAPPPTISIHQRTSRKAGGSPLIAPSSSAPLPSQLQPPPTGRTPRNPAPAPLVSNRQRISSRGVGNLASPPSSPSPPSPYHPGPVLSPSLHPPEAFPKNSWRHHAPPPHIQVLSPAKAPFSSNHSEVAPVPSLSPMIPSRHHEWSHSPILSPSLSFSWNPRAPAPQVITPLPPPPSNLGSLMSPAKAPFSSNHSEVAPVSSPSPMIPSRRHEWSHSPILSPSWSFSWNPRAPAPQIITPLPPPPSNLGPSHSPMLSPSGSFSRNPRTPEPQPVQTLPPPPPNLDCTSFVCVEPLTSTPPGSPCNCVLPIKVGLRLSIALYTFFPLVSELAQEIASGVYMRLSQVRIMGANAANEEPEKTIVLLDLVPLGHTFNNTTAFLTYEKFWHKQIPIKASAFGDYNILYVLYPGLPPSPPTAPNAGDGTFGNGNNGRTIKPLGVDVPKRKDKLNISLIVIILLSSIVALVLVGGAAWLLLLRHGNHTCLHISTPQTLLPSFAKSSVAGSRATILGSQHSSASASFSPNIATFMGSAKIFTLAEIETATKKFDDSRIIGEGGFGRVYEGILEDGTGVAVKVLKRDDQRGVREFLVEVEMLSRLHHRNLVKLTGMCTEDIRCLVYELIPNGSVESHLHGVDKGTAPLDWSARTKIALGAARGLAYLHEDSSPRVIHRDFKSSNILLEYDYTPKISDFGLARTALDEGNEHISTQVMGTFGYVAPEYAMTGHLLVKSDVYSYGVVLLELLTGRKPVDMLKPPGQENLVAWAHPLLTNKEGLEIIIDPALGTSYPCGSVAKVAAIASMCVQPEASHRPFMGEVVQALKLICNEGDDYSGSGSCSQDYSCAQDTERRISVGLGMESGRMLLGSDIFSTSARFSRDTHDSFQRHSSSGPLTTGKNRQFWQRDRSLSTGSMSEHGLSLKSRIGLEGGEEWP